MPSYNTIYFVICLYLIFQITFVIRNKVFKLWYPFNRIELLSWWEITPIGNHEPYSVLNIQILRDLSFCLAAKSLDRHKFKREKQITLVKSFFSKKTPQTYKKLKEESTSWEVIGPTESSEITRILSNPKGHCPVHNRQPLFYPELDETPSRPPIVFLYDPPSIILPSKARSSKYALSFWYPHQNPVRILHAPIRPTSPTHFIVLYLITQVISGAELVTMVQLIMWRCNLVRTGSGWCITMQQLAERVVQTGYILPIHQPL
jgi:hypothetical protein